MAKVKTHILTNSFIIQAGIISVINEIKEINYINIDTQKTELNKYLSENKKNLFIIDKQLFEKTKYTIKKNKIPHIIINPEKTNNENNIFLLENKKHEILDAVKSQIKKILKTTTTNKNNELSPRETAIVKCIAKGMTNKEIADKLFISTHTVITHRKNITKKLGIKSISGITVYAILNNIIDINEIN